MTFITTIRYLNLSKLRICWSRKCNFSTKAERPSYIHNVTNDPLIYRTLGQQFELTASKYGNRIALNVMRDKTKLTFNEILDKADRLAAGLTQLGLSRGDRVGIWAPNTAQWYISFVAAARCGLVSVGLNPAYQTREIDYCLEKVGIKAIIATEGFKTQNYYEMIREVVPELSESKPGNLNCKRLPHLKAIVIDTAKKLPGALTFNEILSLGSAPEISQIKSSQSSIDPDTECNIQFTSGTTGSPKAARLSHFQIVNNGYFIGKRLEHTAAEPTVLFQPPFFHVFGVVVCISGCLNDGAGIVLPGPNFNVSETIETLKTERCSHIYGTPTMYVDLIKRVKDENLIFDHLETAVTGGSPCSPQLFQQIKSTLRLKNIKTVFGQTEGTAVAFSTRPGDRDDITFNSVGYIQDHHEIKVVDESGQCVPFGQPGELCIRGYSTTKGYWGDEIKTKEMLDESKWLKTGDKFVLSEDGCGRIVGRLKDMIIRGGENIAPKEVEDILNTHPDIMETHVIGVPDERLGEEVCSYVRLAAGKTLTHDEMKSFCKRQLAHFKIPKYLRIVSDFPKTTSGKIQKFKLREIFRKSETG